jgi:hypothetical protein
VGFDELALTKLLEVVGKMLACLMGGLPVSYSAGIVEYTREYVCYRSYIWLFDRI